MPGVEQLLDVLPALLVAATRGRWCGRARRPARPPGAGRGRRRGPSPSNVRAAVARPSRRGTTSRPSTIARGQRPGRGLDETDDDVGAALGAAVPLAEHGVRLADARGRARGRSAAARVAMSGSRRSLTVAQPPSCCRARLSSSTLTVGSPRKPSVAPVRCARRPARAPAPASSPRASATRATCCVRVRRADVRVEAGAATRSRRRAGRRRRRRRPARRRPRWRSCDGLEQVGVVRAEVRGADGDVGS